VGGGKCIIGYGFWMKNVIERHVTVHGFTVQGSKVVFTANPPAKVVRRAGLQLYSSQVRQKKGNPER